MWLRREVLERIAKGEVRLAFRRWQRPTVRPGGTLRTAVGVLAIDAVDPVKVGDIPDMDIAAAGYPSCDALLADLRAEGTLYRIALRFAGDDPRAALRDDERIGAPARAEIAARLTHLDRGGPWTGTVLTMIGDAGVCTAAQIAARIGQDKAATQRRIRHLKELGLTESLPTGYRLSPRGRAWLARIG